MEAEVDCDVSLNISFIQYALHSMAVQLPLTVHTTTYEEFQLFTEYKLKPAQI